MEYGAIVCRESNIIVLGKKNSKHIPLIEMMGFIDVFMLSFGKRIFSTCIQNLSAEDNSLSAENPSRSVFHQFVLNIKTAAALLYV